MVRFCFYVVMIPVQTSVSDNLSLGARHIPLPSCWSDPGSVIATHSGDKHDVELDSKSTPPRNIIIFSCRVVLANNLHVIIPILEREGKSMFSLLAKQGGSADVATPGGAD